MIHRRSRYARPALEGLEWRLAPSSMGGGPDGGRRDAADVDRNDNDANDDDAQDAVDRDNDRDNDRDRDRDGRGDGDGGRDNGSWEPKPIGHGSTRPQLPPGPVG